MQLDFYTKANLPQQLSLQLDCNQGNHSVVKITNLFLQWTATTKCPQKWTRTINNSYPEIAYKLAADNTTVMHMEGNVSASAVSMPILCGTTSFKSGQHQWRVSFTSTQPYCAFELISRSERDQLRTKDFGLSFSPYPLFQKFFNALAGHQDTEYTFILDMDNRKCTVKWSLASSNHQA